MMDETKREYICSWRKRRIDARCTHPLYEELVAYLDREEPYHDHYYRYCNTFAALVLNGISFDQKVIRETGDPSVITNFLHDRGFDAASSWGDFRYELKEESGSVDLML